jgi:hypothetical protein
MGYTRCGTWPTWDFRPGTKQGSTAPPLIPHRRVVRRPNLADRQRVAGGGGAKELALEVRIPIWCKGRGRAHLGGLAVVKQVGSGEPATAGWRRGGGCCLRVCGVVVSSDEGRCSDGGVCQWLEVALDRKAASANEGGGRLGASTGPSGGQWLSDRLGVVAIARCLEQRRTMRCRAEWAGARRLLWEEERTCFSFGPTARGEDTQGGGCMRCAWRLGGRWRGQNNTQARACKASDRAPF